MSHSLNVFNQPKPFYMIFSLEFWERFGWAGVQAILAVYFVRDLGYSEAKADIVFGAFFALSFGFLAVGGKLGDAYLGTKRVMVLGAITLAIGYLLLGFARYESSMVFWGLATIAVGEGLFKANPSSLLSRCYEAGDARLDGAFTMYYMSVNLGSMVAMFVVPYLANKYNWQLGFYVCTLGLILCLFTYTTMKGCVKFIGSAPDLEPLKLKRLLLCILGVIASIILFNFLLEYVFLAHLLLYVVGVVVFIIYIQEAFKLEGIERVKMWVSLVLIFEGFLFFILYTQMPTSLNFFAIHNVHHSLFGIPIAPESFQMLNPVWIVVASPILAFFYNKLGSQGRDFSMPVKFAFGMVLCACGFLVLPIAAKTANEQGIISSYWLVLFYGLQSIGELFISGLGLAMVAQFVPKHLSGFIMGAWFLSTAFAAMAAGYIASLTAPPEEITSPVQMLPIYSDTFRNIGIFTAVVAVLMLITAPYLNRVIHRSL